MAKLIHGVPVILHVKTLSSYDPFGVPIYADSTVTVEDVIASPESAEDMATDLNLYGKRAAYTLGIPKGDTHTWTDTEVEFFGQKFRTFGPVLEGIEDLIPLNWNKKVKAEAIE